MSVNKSSIQQKNQENLDWSKLSILQQNQIIKNIFSTDKATFNDYVTQCGLLQNQALGLVSVVGAVCEQLQKEGIIASFSSWDDKKISDVIRFLDGTRIGTRIQQGISDVSKEVISIDGEAFVASHQEYQRIAHAQSIEDAKELILDIFGLDYLNLSHERFLVLYNNDHILLHVDKSLVNANWMLFGIQSHLVNILLVSFYIGLVAAIPCFIYISWWSSLIFILASLICRKNMLSYMARKAEEIVIIDKKFFDECKKRGIIRFVDITKIGNKR